MYLWLTLAIIFASLEVIAVSKRVQRLEFVAKPAAMICLFTWLYASTGLQGKPLWFGLGILFSLVGDVLLMIPLDRMFLFGLIAFLVAHISYIAGFADALVSASPLAWMVVITISTIRLLQLIIRAMQAKWQSQLIYAVIIYGAVISLMLYAAISTMYDPAWEVSAALLVSAGAVLFWTSDLILAWDKFVSAIKNGRVFNIVTYYLGQIGLIAGVISQFG